MSSLVLYFLRVRLTTPMVHCLVSYLPCLAIGSLVPVRAKHPREVGRGPEGMPAHRVSSCYASCSTTDARISA